MSGFASPEQNINELHLKDNSVVVDLGCGTGHYVFAVASALQAMGKKGVVYAVDVQKNLLDKVAVEATRRGFDNIRVIWSDIDVVGGIKLSDAVADIVIVSNVLFQSENKENFLREGIRLLKSGGELMIIDWLDSNGGLGPNQDLIVRAEVVELILQSLGLSKKKDFGTGAHHWGVIFRKP